MEYSQTSVDGQSCDIVTISPDDTAASASAEALSSQRTVERCKIAFFGIFGLQNLGNECTLQAILENARKRLPSAEIHAVSFNPEDTIKRHDIPAFAVSNQKFAAVVRRSAIAKVLRLCKRIPGELNDWLAAIKTLRGTEVLILTGTGMLTDYMTTASGFPYDVFRWSAAGRLAGCKVRFVGVGVGPIYGRLSRWLIRTALTLADYRSFRDQNSKKRIKDIGFNSDNDPVFPDLVFSLPRDLLPHRARPSNRPRRVGLGVMDHRDIHLWDANQHEIQYSSYLDKMCDFVLWLIRHEYQVRILQGDAKHDASTRGELRSRLEKRGIQYDKAGIIDEGSTSVQELTEQIADVDVVVSPRFHNLLLGLMLGIPVVSISYDPKNDSLLDGVGLEKYRQPLYGMSLQKLIDQFVDIAERGWELKPRIDKSVAEYRVVLESQYDILFDGLA